MVFTDAQTTSFFWDSNQMDISARTRTSIAAEWLTNLADLVKFDKASLKHISENLHHPGGHMPDPDQPISAHATIPLLVFVFGAKSQLRLKSAVDISKYYETNERDMTVGYMRWTQTIKNFVATWKSLSDCKDSTDIEVPNISKSLPIMKCTEAFSDFNRRVIGTRTIPLSYVVCEESAPPATAPNLENNQPFATEFGSVEEELINHPLYRDSNASLYFH